MTKTFQNKLISLFQKRILLKQKIFEKIKIKTNSQLLFLRFAHGYFPIGDQLIVRLESWKRALAELRGGKEGCVDLVLLKVIVFSPWFTLSGFGLPGFAFLVFFFFSPFLRGLSKGIIFFLGGFWKANPSLGGPWPVLGGSL